jgi:hypothetical protein
VITESRLYLDQALRQLLKANIPFRLFLILLHLGGTGQCHGFGFSIHTIHPEELGLVTCIPGLGTMTASLPTFASMDDYFTGTKTLHAYQRLQDFTPLVLQRSSICWHKELRIV